MWCRDWRWNRRKNVIVLNLPEIKTKLADKEDNYLAIKNLEKVMNMEGIKEIDWDDAYRLGKFQE